MHLNAYARNQPNRHSVPCANLAAIALVQCVVTTVSASGAFGESAAANPDFPGNSAVRSATPDEGRHHSAGPVSNDDCANRILIENGATPYDTTGATTDGPEHPDPTRHGPGHCGRFGTATVFNNVWYSHVATCTGALTVTTCEELGGSANFDTRIAIYDDVGGDGACDCPMDASGLLVCNDDDPDHPCGGARGGYHSAAHAPVQAGNCYVISLGAFADGDAGSGDLFVSCDAPVCGDNDLDVDEECDGIDADVCPGLCLPDCTCSTAVPTMSQWGASVLALLLVASGTIVFGGMRRGLTAIATSAFGSEASLRRP